MVARSILPPDVIAVLGAGNMGSGIAQACAQAGFRVRVRDVSDAMLQRGRSLVEKTLEGGIRRKKLTPAKRDEILGRIEWTLDVARAVGEAALVIEAVFEEEAVKRTLLAEVARSVPPEAIVATNTSSLSVNRLSEGFPNPAGSPVSTSSTPPRSTSCSRSSGASARTRRPSRSSNGSPTPSERSRSGSATRRDSP